MLLSLIKVKGHSMEPFLKEGSFFIASNLSFFFQSPKVNDVILFKDKNKIIVKKIFKIENQKYFIIGVNKNDSKFFSPIKKNDILGKLIFKL